MHPVLPCEQHPFPDVSKVGVLGHLLLNQRRCIGNGIADGFHKERLFSDGYLERAEPVLLVGDPDPATFCTSLLHH
jgi:hypothetical protein